MAVAGIMMQTGTISALNLPTDKISSNFIESGTQLAKKIIVLLVVEMILIVYTVSLIRQTAVVCTDNHQNSRMILMANNNLFCKLLVS